MDNLNLEFQPILENVKIIKLLYKTKLSHIWLAKYFEQFVVLKGKKRSELSNDEFEFLKRERNFLESNLNNKKRINFSHFIKSAKDDEFLYMIINFIEGATLSQVYKENIFRFNQIISEDDFNVKKYFYLYIISQILNFIVILDDDNFIYRDLKLNNIIINKNLELFLIDYGFVKQIENRTNTICGTYHSMAPEVFKTKFNLQDDYNKSVDIYSYGVLLYELFCFNPPFPYLFDFDEENLKNYFENISKGLKDEIHFEENFINFNNNEGEDILKFVENLKDLIKGCMHVDVEKRYNLEQIKQHNLFDGDHTKFLNSVKIDYDSKWIKEIIESIDFNGDFAEEVLVEDIFDKYF